MRLIPPSTLLPLLVALLATAPCGVAAQDGPEWFERWQAAQRLTLQTVESATMQEAADFRLQAAGGSRRIEITSAFVLRRGPQAITRTEVQLSVDGERLPPDEQDLRRRYAAPLGEDLQRATELILHPTAAALGQEPTGEVESDTLSSIPVIGIRTRARGEDVPVARMTWWFERSTGRLAFARAFIVGPDGAAIDTWARFERIEGLDLPMRRGVEGSLVRRRRMRTYTVLIDAGGRLSDHVVRRSTAGRE